MFDARWMGMKAALIVVVAGLPAVSEATTYSRVGLNASANPVVDRRTTDSTGGVLEDSSSGTSTLAFNNGNGTFVAKPVTHDVYAKASLETGELKTKASLSFGSDLTTSPFVPGIKGANNGSASATAAVADSFSVYAADGVNPFLWTDGTTAQFQFAVTADVSISAGIEAPTANPYLTPGEWKNQVYTILDLLVLKPGTLELIDQRDNLDWSDPNALTQFYALTAAIEDGIITSSQWYLGDYVAEYTPVNHVALDDSGAANISFDFAPDGDFEWSLTLTSSVQLDASLQNVSATLDFSHTITTTYAGPAGSITYSDSGVFPGTLALDDQPTSSAVPEPASLSLLAMGGVALLAVRRRRSRR